jgi:hypothetical protein
VVFLIGRHVDNFFGQIGLDLNFGNARLAHLRTCSAVIVSPTPMMISPVPGSLTAALSVVVDQLLAVAILLTTRR